MRVLMQMFSCRVSELLDYSSDELVGKNLYAICHAEDVSKLRKCHVDCKFIDNFYIMMLSSNKLCCIFCSSLIHTC